MRVQKILKSLSFITKNRSNLQNKTLFQKILSDEEVYSWNYWWMVQIKKIWSLFLIKRGAIIKIRVKAVPNLNKMMILIVIL